MPPGVNETVFLILYAPRGVQCGGDRKRFTGVVCTGDRREIMRRCVPQWKCETLDHVITTRIRRMTEGNVLTLSTIAGGDHHPADEGVLPSQVRWEGRGYPLPKFRWGPWRGECGR